MSIAAYVEGQGIVDTLPDNIGDNDLREYMETYPERTLVAKHVAEWWVQCDLMYEDEWPNKEG